MSDSEDSDVDVCSIDEATAANLHTGLTIVAAETFISNESENTDSPVPLNPEDLLTREKQDNKNTSKDLSKQCEPLQSLETLQTSKEESMTNLTTTDVMKSPVSSVSPVEKDASPKHIVSQPLDTTMQVDEQTVEKDIEDMFCDNNNENESVVDSEEELFDTGVNNMLNKFYFESDHLAIKNNKDYHMLLKSLAVLEAQRVQAIKDLEDLHRLKKDALSDPLQFVKNLQEKKGPKLPDRQHIAKLPTVNWLHYMTAYSGSKYVPQITTRKSVKSQEQAENESLIPEFDDIDEESMDDSIFEDGVKKKKAKIDKNPTFNQKWTVEEQEKLEKLLILYPPEDVEARRWEKIANALGNRTPQQVCSRIQKYFLKLAKAKLPIPGRMPSATTMLNNKKVKINLLSYKNSSFFPSWQPNVKMKDEDDDDYDADTMQNAMSNEHCDVSDEEMIPDEYKDSPEYHELMELKKMKIRLLKEEKKVDNGPAVHNGFMCDGCNMDPIVGVRWHCKDCPVQQSTDFCNNCAQKNYSSDTHFKTHQLTPVNEGSKTFLDDDYLSFEQRNKFKYNYLDPNFLPGSKPNN